MQKLILIIIVYLLFTNCSSLALELQVNLEQSSVKQGQTFVVYVEPSERPSKIFGTFLDKEIKIYPWGYKYRGIFAVPLDTKEGIYPVFVHAFDNGGNLKETDTEIKILKGRFPVESFQVPKTKAQLLTPKIIEADWAKIGAVITRESEAQQWYLKFKMPTNGRTSMYFGAHETINHKSSGRHKGMDIANKMGTPIKAANFGTVVLAEKLLAHGNTIILDHGQGIFTMYLHLSKIAVKLGAKVTKGQVIGAMGVSGVASGSHLHYGMSVHDVRVDPMQWIREMVAE